MDSYQSIPFPIIGVCVICAYFTLSPFRSLVLDVLCSLVVIYFTAQYYQLEQSVEKQEDQEQVEEETAECTDENEDENKEQEQSLKTIHAVGEDISESTSHLKIHFSVDEMKSLSSLPESQPQPDGRTFQIIPVETIRNEPRTPRSPLHQSNTSSNNENNVDANTNSNGSLSSEVHETMSFRKRTPAPGALYMPLNRSRSPEVSEHAYRETPDLFDCDIQTLPTGTLRGPVKLLNKNNGRIKLPYKINDLHDVFFHFKDLEIDSDDQLEVGDIVEYQLSTFQNKLCAIHVKRSLVSSISVPSLSGDLKKTKKYLQPDSTTEVNDNWRQ